MSDIATYQADVTAGGTVTIPPGSYTQSTALLIPPSTALTLSGYGVTVTLDAVMDGVGGHNERKAFVCFDSNDVDDVTFANVTIEGFTVDGSACALMSEVVGNLWSTRNNYSNIIIKDLDITLPPTRTDPVATPSHIGVSLTSSLEPVPGATLELYAATAQRLSKF